MNNGVYPKDIWFRCTGIEGVKCTGRFTMHLNSDTTEIYIHLNYLL